ncbi:hypothetical protein TNCT_501061 [Trichonephila clavata]|uniref:Uncharacterized protein n=1 Tax=Trichonephila clavata TaxID=2740835 RepID=A0A8X6KM38_TRICU|nr:hypothetical protein TNCT_501061 [Trichonephila clavata]
MSLSILEDSIKHKPAKKRLVRSESESDVESINDEDDRNSLFGSIKNRRPRSLEANSQSNRKLWSIKRTRKI